MEDAGFRTKPQHAICYLCGATFAQGSHRHYRTLTPADVLLKGEPTVGRIDIWANVHPRAFTPGAPL